MGESNKVRKWKMRSRRSCMLFIIDMDVNLDIGKYDQMIPTENQKNKLKMEIGK